MLQKMEKSSSESGRPTCTSTSEMTPVERPIGNDVTEKQKSSPSFQDHQDATDWWMVRDKTGKTGTVPGWSLKTLKLEAIADFEQSEMSVRIGEAYTVERMKGSSHCTIRNSTGTKADVPVKLFRWIPYTVCKSYTGTESDTFAVQKWDVVTVINDSTICDFVDDQESKQNGITPETMDVDLPEMSLEAVYDYNAVEDGHLSFKQGDLFHLQETKQSDKGDASELQQAPPEESGKETLTEQHTWSQVENIDGKVGFIKSEILKEGRLIALQDYDAKEGHISLKENQIVELKEIIGPSTCRVRDAHGENTEGIVPSDCLQWTPSIVKENFDSMDSHQLSVRRNDIVHLIGTSPRPKDDYYSTEFEKLLEVTEDNILIKIIECESIRHLVDFVDDLGDTLLHKAGRYLNGKACKMLLRHGASVRARNKSKSTPLHSACRTIREEFDEDNKLAIEQLAESEVLNTRDVYGLTPIHVAASKGNYHVCKELINIGQNVDVTDNVQGRTPLHTAVLYNRIDIIKLLIDNGAKIGIRDKCRWNALDDACSIGSEDIVKSLMTHLKEKEHINPAALQENYFRSALEAAFSNKKLHIVKILSVEGADISTLNLGALAMERDEKFIQQFVLTGNATELRDGKGWNALHHAAMHNNAVLAKSLLEIPNVDHDTRTINQETPLMLAVFGGSKEVADLLLDKGAVVIGRYVDGGTVLHSAIENDDLQMVEKLLSRGADVNVKNNEGKTPFIYALLKNNLRIMQILCAKYKYLLSEPDHAGNTPLHIAAKAGLDEVVKFLLEHVIDPKLVNSKNNEGMTPLHQAASGDNTLLVKRLMDIQVQLTRMEEYSEQKKTTQNTEENESTEAELREAEKTQSLKILNEPDGNGRTPLELAALNGQYEVFKELFEQGAEVRRSIVYAVRSKCSDIINHILQSKYWQVALACGDFSLKDGMLSNPPPLRLLFSEMPDAALHAMWRCISIANEGDISFDYKFLDDAHTDYASLASDSSAQMDDTEKQNYSRMTIFDLHPLSVMVKASEEQENERLVEHPLAVALLHKKWKLTRKFYYLFLIIYGCFLSLFTAAIYHVPGPIRSNSSVLCLDKTAFETTQTQLALQSFTAVFAVAGLVIELFLAYKQRRIYIMGPKVWTLMKIVVRWSIYIFAIVVTVFTPSACAVQEVWQYQLAVPTLLAGWLYGLLTLRWFPLLRIYINMFTDIFVTFLKFAFVWIWLIWTFALPFYLLLRNQEPFSTLGRASLKTAVMGFGEFDYSSIFHDDGEEQLFPAMTAVIFSIFLAIIGLIVINLLIALAVDDVARRKKRAKIITNTYKINFVLSVEFLSEDTQQEALEPPNCLDKIEEWLTYLEGETPISLKRYINEHRRLCSQKGPAHTLDRSHGTPESLSPSSTSMSVDQRNA